MKILSIVLLSILPVSSFANEFTTLSCGGLIGSSLSGGLLSIELNPSNSRINSSTGESMYVGKHSFRGIEITSIYVEGENDIQITINSKDSFAETRSNLMFGPTDDYGIRRTSRISFQANKNSLTDIDCWLK